MSRTPETTLEWVEHYDKLMKRAEQNYQETGELRYDKAAYKYSVIVDALMAKRREETEQALDLKKRITNRDAVIDRLEYRIHDNFSYAEVVELLKEAVYW